LPRAAGGEAMRTMREGLVRLSEDVHALSYRLHPSIIEDLGLMEALNTECQRFSALGSTRVEVNAQDIREEPPRHVALCLFRVAQEALQNTAHHAEASLVQITVRPLNGGLQLAIHDDGNGFDPERHRDRPSLGLASMRQRIDHLGGSLDIESAPSQGTTVLAWVPLKEERCEPSARAAG
jgi:signal transduction histidine kinase